MLQICASPKILHLQSDDDSGDGIMMIITITFV